MICGAAGVSSAASEQRNGPQVMYITSPVGIGSCPAPVETRSNLKDTPSPATMVCIAFQVRSVNGVWSSPASTTTPEASSTNIGVTRAETEEDTIMFRFACAIAFVASDWLSGQNTWPPQARSASASGGLMLTMSGIGATSLIPITAALQSLTVGDSRSPPVARTRMYISMSGSASARCIVSMVNWTSAVSRPAIVAATWNT